MVRLRPSFTGLLPASPITSRVARASSAKRDTKPELLLRRALRQIGVRYRVDSASLPGRPDLIVPSVRLAVFCDGDFWHGRNLRQRLRKLGAGHNATYWTSKIKSNVDRDRRTERLLRDLGWDLLRFWETDVCANPARAALIVSKAVHDRRTSTRGKRRSARKPTYNKARLL